jgi:hypothetical protein
MKSKNIKFRGMSCSFQSSQLGLIVSFQDYFISPSFTILRQGTGPRHFTSFCRLLDDNRNINFIDIKPIVTYDNADVDKVKIFADNRNKSGVYRWINNKNGNSYVGSSINFSVRFYTTRTEPQNLNLSFVVGFIDAEGSFTIYMRQDSRYTLG